MKRREFITKSTLATAGISSVITVSCDDSQINKQLQTNIDQEIPSFELDEETISSLQSKMKLGEFTSVQITQLYLNRINEIDKNGPRINAVIELNPDALSIAQSMDDERKTGKSRGPLHGIPILIKDNIDTGDKMRTTAGSLAILDNIASKDAFIVQKLRASGAVILGKTNLSEWANFRSTNSCSGWSSRGGQTKCPYILDHNPCGSSSGSGSAVSSNLCTVAIGTETDGSVTCPASVNGIVGLKPTVGLVSRSGIIPISSTQDTAGPMARTVTDVAILLNAMIGIDESDVITKESMGKTHEDYTKFLKIDGLKGKRIGIDKNPQGNNQYMHILMNNALNVLKQQGAEVIEIDYFEKIKTLAGDEFELLKYEFKDGLNKYLFTANSKVKSLADVIKFNLEHEDEAMPYFKQEILEDSERKDDLKSEAYKNVYMKSHIASKKIIDEVMQNHKLDAICGLTMGPACSIDMIYGDRWGEVFLTMPAAITGYPHISVPGGKVYDLPVGISFFGLAYSESSLIEIAFGFEQSTKHRETPKFKTSFLK